ncbi:small t protein [Betapolyomavirus canis]|uniref:Small t antigen n=1 Tax=Betapolyomavirus canis TaxID=1980633 RepID=A0A1W6EU81_9POLY|nr:small t protein [Betapolyomavirus canis]ARK19243.1 small t protein [Betapolyomavirus canis]
MDNTLPREEAKELMSLLGLDMCVWGNLPLIRKAYLKQCKELHPDKGGDEEKMKRMNVLYKKLQDKINEIHGSNAWTYVPEEVGDCGWHEFLCKDWNLCAVQRLTAACSCLMCDLRRLHSHRSVGRKPLVWIDCYCFDCFRTWFGLDLTWATCLMWQKVLSLTNFCDLKLW